MTTATTSTATKSQSLASSIHEALTETRFLTQERKFTEAIQLLTPFADSGDRNVLFSLNYAHDKRRLPGDRAQARTYLKAAAALGHEKAISLIARRNLARWIGAHGHKSDLRPLAIEAVKAFVPQCLLAQLDLPTVPTADLMVAVTAALERKVQEGDPLAKAALGVALLRSVDRSEYSTAKALRLLESTADDGRLESVRFLGRAYTEGQLLPADTKKAFGYFSFGAEMDCLDSRHLLAECYMFGQGVEKDIHQTVRLLKENTRAGYAFSPCLLGRLLVEGTELPQEIEQGLELLKLSVSRRCPHAAAELAHFFFWHPAYATIGYERQAYAFIAAEQGNKSQAHMLQGIPAEQIPQLMKSVDLIKSLKPNPLY
jgi:TPR repeat protein